jgi:hypothetical protein
MTEIWANKFVILWDGYPVGYSYIRGVYYKVFKELPLPSTVVGVVNDISFFDTYEAALETRNRICPNGEIEEIQFKIVA